MILSDSTIWLTIVLASVVSYSLRAIPFIANGLFRRIPSGLATGIHLCGYAIIGSMMAETVFAPFFSGDPSSLAVKDVFFRLSCTAFALFLMLKSRKPVLSLSLGYLAFVICYLCLVTGSAIHE